MHLVFQHLDFNFRFMHRQMEGWELENEKVSASEGKCEGKRRTR